MHAACKSATSILRTPIVTGRSQGTVDATTLLMFWWRVTKEMVRIDLFTRGEHSRIKYTTCLKDWQYKKSVLGEKLKSKSSSSQPWSNTK
jgi:hypothetical protein